MKLTKGKLSKIRNKKNQSAKRFKKSGKGRNTKTFRKRKALNLHNTSLKKYKGGKGPKLPENVPQVVEPTKVNKPVVVQPTTDVVQEMPKEMPPTTDVVQEMPKEMPPTTDVVQEMPKEMPPTTDVVGETQEIPPTTDVVEEMPKEMPPTTDVVGETQEIPPTTDVVDENPGEGPGSHQALPPPVSEIGSDSAEVSPAAKKEMVEDGTNATPDVVPVSNLENGSESGSEIGSEDAASLSETEKAPEMTTETEPQPIEGEQSQSQQKPLGNDMSIVAESLDKLAEYISDKIAKKLNLGTGNSSTDLNRDSFNAVANANNALVEA